MPLVFRQRAAAVCDMATGRARKKAKKTIVWRRKFVNKNKKPPPQYIIGFNTFQTLS